ncbi:hypothetical protein SCE1572_51550 [Sorangium cellulosum So0157-2]|uniref:Uncharacterized protein n=1 Tax=Sorangium cellulosum So0157-2 TaxID=1254432 RepID=S4Y9K1_SORCE|nr:hypothetical protein SCE1572_51550 [Sorangium cellulosum So0157-2]
MTRPGRAIACRRSVQTEDSDDLETNEVEV